MVGLAWFSSKVKIAVLILAKLVRSAKEEILTHFLGKELKCIFQNGEDFTVHSLLPHKC